MERVSTYTGKVPVIIVAPHGHDDKNSADIAETAIKNANCYGVINRGFERADSVDVDNDKADCNRIDQVMQDVVCDEFLSPIEKYVQRIENRMFSQFPGRMNWNPNLNTFNILVLYVHGCGNKVHTDAGEQVQMVIGWGKGKKSHSFTCEEWRKSCLGALVGNYALDGVVYEDSGGGRYAGRSSNNMNQYFRTQQFDQFVDSMQLEFPYSTRRTSTQAAVTGMMLASAINDYLTHDSYATIKFPTV